MILTLTGASGAGKTTLAKAMVRVLPSAELSPGCTTRAMRPNETSSDAHHLSRQEFSEMHQRGEFLWAVEVHGNWYGTLRRVVAAGLERREHCLILALTPNVLPLLKDFATKFGRREAVHSAYVLSPEPNALRARLNSRESDKEVIERRIVDCLKWDINARSSGLYDFLVPGEGDVEVNARELADNLAAIRSK